MNNCKRVLILNEDWGFGVALSKILLKEGFLVQTSNSPQEALELMNKTAFEILIVDLSQKESWFWDLVQQLPENLPPVIFLSPSLTNFLKFQKLPRSENFLFLEKPVNREELVASIQKLLASERTLINFSSLWSWKAGMFKFLTNPAILSLVSCRTLPDRPISNARSVVPSQS